MPNHPRLPARPEHGRPRPVGRRLRSEGGPGDRNRPRERGACASRSDSRPADGRQRHIGRDGRPLAAHPHSLGRQSLRTRRAGGRFPVAHGCSPFLGGSGCGLRCRGRHRAFRTDSGRDGRPYPRGGSSDAQRRDHPGHSPGRGRGWPRSRFRRGFRSARGVGRAAGWGRSSRRPASAWSAARESSRTTVGDLTPTRSARRGHESHQTCTSRAASPARSNTGWGRWRRRRSSPSTPTARRT